MAALTTTNPVVAVWPEGVMPGHGAEGPEMLSSPEKTDTRRITNISHPTLTLFSVPATNAPAPFVLVCPGGGYNYVTYDKEGVEIAGWLNSNGISAAVLKYRTPRNREGAFQDVQRSLSLARARAAEWNIDPYHIGIIGFSAGGNLSAKASTRFNLRSYTPMDNVDQQSCRPDFAILVYPAYLANTNGQLSADLPITANIPPTLIVHDEDDPTTNFVTGSKLYDAALTKAQVPHQFLLYATGGHGYGLHCAKDAKAWPQAAVGWLKANKVISN